MDKLIKEWITFIKDRLEGEYKLKSLVKSTEEAIDFLEKSKITYVSWYRDTDYLDVDFDYNGSATEMRFLVYTKGYSAIRYPKYLIKDDIPYLNELAAEFNFAKRLNEMAD